MRIVYNSTSDEITIHLTSAANPALVEEIRDEIALLRDRKGKIAALRIPDASRNIDLKALAAHPDYVEDGNTEDSRDAPAAAKAASVTIFSDGACSGNPGPGGWGARLIYPDGRICELGGFEADTTNNRMELTAAIRGLERAGDIPSVTMVTDSEYTLKGITQWIQGWKRRGWMTASKKPVLNQDLWRRLDALNRPGIEWKYTRGHAGDPDNERCDEIAQAFSRGEFPELVED